MVTPNQEGRGNVTREYEMEFDDGRNPTSFKPNQLGCPDCGIGWSISSSRFIGTINVQEM